MKTGAPPPPSGLLLVVDFQSASSIYEEGPHPHPHFDQMDRMFRRGEPAVRWSVLLHTAVYVNQPTVFL